MPDARVTHYWDGDRIVGQWFAEYGGTDGRGQVFHSVWDRHFLYGSAAEWQDNRISERYLDTDYPIYYHTENLELQIAELLALDD